MFLKEKRGKAIIIIISVICVVLILVLGYFYFNYNKNDNSRNSGNSSEQKLVNPVEGLSDEEAIGKFNESFIFYLLISIKAYNLHSPPLSSDTPKIEIVVDGDAYNAEVVNKGIRIGRGAIDGEDIVIRTTKEEGVRMLRDKNYISESFQEGRSNVELIAGKVELVAKGYMKIYEELS